MPTDRNAGSDRIPLYILAGGSSRRFGSNKARALFDGVPLITRLAKQLEPVVSSTTVVAAKEAEYDDLGFATIRDDVPDLGPAGGIVTALRHRLRHGGAGWTLVSACDWAAVEADWVRVLQKGITLGAVAVLFDPDQPLFGLYHTGAEPLLAGAIDAGNLRMQELAATLTPVTVPAPVSFAAATNVNRPGDLDRQ